MFGHYKKKGKHKLATKQRYAHLQRKKYRSYTIVVNNRRSDKLPDWDKDHPYSWHIMDDQKMISIKTRGMLPPEKTSTTETKTETSV